VAILGIREGKFGFYDYTGYKIPGTRKLECEMTIKGGKIVYDLDGIANPIVLPRPHLPLTQPQREHQANKDDY
jgi:dihydroorotase